MMVKQSTTPVTMCSNVSHHPAMKNQMTLPTVDPTPFPGCGTTARPNGQTPKSAILSDATPNGIVMIKTKQISAAKAYPMNNQSPANTNQMMFSSSRTQQP